MTTDAVVLAFLFIHVGVILVATAYFVLGAALTPRLTERTRLRFARRPWLPLLLGLLLSVPWVVTSLILLQQQAGGLRFAGAVIGLLWVLLGLVGASGIAQHVGRGGAEGPATLAHTMRGGLVIAIAWILPLVGWLGVLPLTLVAGVGSLLMSPFPVRPGPVAIPVPVPVPVTAATPPTAARS